MGMPLPAFAEKPTWAGNGNGGKHGNPGAKGNKGNGGQHGAGRANRNSGRNWNNQAGNRYPGAGNYPAQNFSFDNRQRAIIHDYFAPRFQSGAPGEEAAFLAFALRGALQSGLASLEGVFPKSGAEVDAVSGPPSRVSRAVAADEVIETDFACQARSCSGTGR